MTGLVTEEMGEIDALDRDVFKAIQNNSILSENVQEEIESETTFGQRVADNIALFGGSWTFIICFFSFLLLWIVANIWFLSFKAFDPYPFILLNLILSCLAAIQAPIIMMSQNRKDVKDRKRADQDYKVNLKADLK